MITKLETVEESPMLSESVEHSKKRWFGVVRDKQNKLFCGSALVDDFHTQEGFLSEKLGAISGDMVLEIFQSSVLTRRDFEDYFENEYLRQSRSAVDIA